MPLLERLRPYPVSVFAVATLLVWGNRVWLAWTDRKLDLAGKLGYSVPITAFVVAALVVLWFLLTDRPFDRRFRALVAAFAAGTVLYWLIRLPTILLRHHPASFKLVHTALALVLVGLAVRVIRFLGQRSGPGTDPRPRNSRASVNHP
ncbi:MAG: hypothetical protein M3Z46_03490 [Actinomycetota bacterium]|nr:hypothetical protein [Actinomycetota bacterium]